VTEISGATKVAAVIGDPVAHSRSPAIHNAAFAELGLDWAYVALHVPAGRGGDAVRAIPAIGIAGINVTMPHKDDAASACDALSEVSTMLGAVNTVVARDDGTTWGTSTDGEGFVRSVRASGFEPRGRRVLVLGAGGAARSVVLALGVLGAHVTVAARRVDAAEAAAGLVPGGVALELEAAPRAVADVDAVVNATPLGMSHAPAVPAGAVPGKGQWAIDLVYEPARTPFLQEAARRGADTIGGLGMLVHQAALAFELFTGREAPIDAMGRAAQAAAGGAVPSQ
jgi:shikimate dehydrogenase